MELVGRERELKQLGELLDDAVGGAGSTAILSGEAGIGKTRLVSEFISISGSRGVKVFSGSTSADSVHPFLVFSDALGGQLDRPLFRDSESISFTEIFVINRSGLLMDTLIAWFRAEGCMSVMINVYAANSAAANFYKRYGLKLLGETYKMKL